MKKKIKILALLFSFTLSFSTPFSARAQVGAAKIRLYWQAAKLGMQAQQWVRENVSGPAYSWWLNNAVGGGLGKPVGLGETVLFEAGTALGEIGVTAGVGGATQGVQQSIRGIAARTATKVGVAEMGSQLGSKVTLTGNVLGEGSAGTVYEATLGNRMVAVKVATHGVNATARETRRMVIQEAKMARELAREGIGGVEYHGLTRVEGRLGIVTNKIPAEYIAKGESMGALTEAEYAVVRQNATELAERLAQRGYAIGDYQFGINTKGDLLLYDLEGITTFDKFLLPGESPVDFLIRRMDMARKVTLQRRTRQAVGGAAAGLVGGPYIGDSTMGCVGMLCKPK